MIYLRRKYVGPMVFIKLLISKTLLFDSRYTFWGWMKIFSRKKIYFLNLRPVPNYRQQFLEEKRSVLDKRFLFQKSLWRFVTKTPLIVFLYLNNPLQTKKPRVSKVQTYETSNFVRKVMIILEHADFQGRFSKWANKSAIELIRPEIVQIEKTDYCLLS